MERLGPDVERELRRFGPASGMAELVAVWPEAVGPAIAQSAWPARFADDGTLVVHTADTVWAFELHQRAPEIARRLGELVPNGVRFIAGPLPETAGTDADPEPAPLREASPEEAARAEAWARSIENSGLRETVARAARASLARASVDPRSGRSF